MNKKSKIFFTVFGLLISFSVAVSYYQFMIKRDYIIEAEADCDPYTEACFVYVCDPETEECTGDIKEDTSYYKLINRNAKNIPLCNPGEEGCDAVVCPSGEKGCSFTLCDETVAEDGVTCSDPLVYAAENPIEEEVTEDAMDETSDSVTDPDPANESPESTKDVITPETEEVAN